MHIGHETHFSTSATSPVVADSMSASINQSIPGKSYNEKIAESFAKGEIPDIYATEIGLLDLKSSQAIEFNKKMRAIYNSIIPDKYKEIIGDDIRFLLSTDSEANAYALRMEKPPTIVLNAGLLSKVIDVDDDFKRRLLQTTSGEFLSKFVGDRKQLKLIENIDELALIIAHETWHLVEQKKAGVNRIAFKTEESTADFKAFEFLTACGLSVEKAALFCFKLSQDQKASWVDELRDSHLRALNRDKLASLAVARFIGATPAMYKEKLNSAAQSALERVDSLAVSQTEKLRLISEDQNLTRKSQLQARNQILSNGVFDEVKALIEDTAKINYWSKFADKPNKVKALVLSKLEEFKKLRAISKNNIEECFIVQTLDALKYLQSNLDNKEFRKLVSDVVKKAYCFNYPTTKSFISKLCELTEKKPFNLTEETRAYAFARHEFISEICSATADLKKVHKLASQLVKSHDALIKEFGAEAMNKFQIFDFRVVEFNPRLKIIPWEFLYGKIKDPQLAKALTSVGLVQDVTIAKEIINTFNMKYATHEEYLPAFQVVGKGLTDPAYPVRVLFFYAGHKINVNTLFDETLAAEVYGETVSSSSVKYIDFAISSKDHILEKETFITADICKEDLTAKVDSLLKDITAALANDLAPDPLKVAELINYNSILGKSVAAEPFIEASEYALLLRINAQSLQIDDLGSSREIHNRRVKIATSLLNDLFRKADDTENTIACSKARTNIQSLFFDKANEDLRFYLLMAESQMSMWDLPIVKLIKSHPNVLSKDQVVDILQEVVASARNLKIADEAKLDSFLMKFSVITKDAYTFGDLCDRLKQTKSLTSFESVYLTYKLAAKISMELPEDSRHLIASFRVFNDPFSSELVVNQNEVLSKLIVEMERRLKADSLSLEEQIGVLNILTELNKISRKESREHLAAVFKKIKQQGPESRINLTIDLLTDTTVLVHGDFEALAKTICNAASELYDNYDSRSVPAIRANIDRILNIRNKADALKLLDRFASIVRLKPAECAYIRESIDKIAIKERHAIIDRALIYELIKEASKDDPDFKVSQALLSYLLKPNAEPDVLVRQLFEQKNYGPKAISLSMSNLRFKIRNEKNLIDKQKRLVEYAKYTLTLKEDELDPEDRIFKSKIINQIKDMHTAFVSANAITQAIMLREIIIQDDENRNRYNRIMNFSQRILFPNDDKESKIVKSFILSYGNNLHPTQRSVFGCILLNSTRNHLNSKSGSAEFLLDVLSTNALKIKGGQKAAVTNGIPKRFQEVLIKLTENADKPFYWEFDAWIETVKAEVSAAQSLETGDELAPAECGDLVDILGSASISVAGSLAKEGQATGNVITIIRPDTPSETQNEGQILSAVVADIRKNCPELTPQANIFEKLVVSSDSRLSQELTTARAKELFRRAATMYEPVTIEVDGVKHSFKVPRVLANGSIVAKDWKEYHYVIMEEIKGKSISSLLGSGIPAEQLKSYCKAICAMEFFNIARGRFCSDRTNGNVLLNPESRQIGQIDFLGMLDKQWQASDYMPVIKLIKKLMSNAKQADGSESMSKILVKLAESTETSQDSELVKEIEKALLSINIFAQQLTQKELLAAALSGIIAAPGGPLKEYLSENYSEFESLISELTGYKLPPRMFVDSVFFSGKVPPVAFINGITNMGLYQFSIN